MLCVLDLDQTLIDASIKKKNYCCSRLIKKCFARENNTCFEHCGYDVYERPFLLEFLEFIFTNFKYVALWSSGKQIWIDGVLNNCPSFQKFKDKFLFIWSRNRTTFKAKKPNSTKPLAKIWRQKKYKLMGITSLNTLIIDDQSKNFVKNYGNGLHINEFDCKTDDIIRDNGIWYGFYGLEAHIELLKEIITKWKKNPNIRLIKKTSLI